jgi:hypothetical protein
MENTCVIQLKSVRKSRYVRREGLEIMTLIKKIEEYIPLDFMKIKGSRLARRVHIV